MSDTVYVLTHNQQVHIATDTLLARTGEEAVRILTKKEAMKLLAGESIPAQVNVNVSDEVVTGSSVAESKEPVDAGDATDPFADVYDALAATDDKDVMEQIGRGFDFELDKRLSVEHSRDAVKKAIDKAVKAAAKKPAK